MPDGGTALAQALGELSALGRERDREQLAAQRDRLAEARLRVLVAGAPERGKSTLVNTLPGRGVLPSGVLPSGVPPLTAVTATVRYGEDGRAGVRFLDGHDEKHPLAVLAGLVTGRGDPGDRSRIAGVTVYLAAPILAGGVELAGTTGTGSVFEWDTQTAHEALPTMDAAVFVQTADPPVSAAEGDLLGRVAGLPVTTFTVVNKAGHLDPPGHWRSPGASARGTQLPSPELAVGRGRPERRNEGRQRRPPGGYARAMPGGLLPAPHDSGRKHSGLLTGGG